MLGQIVKDRWDSALSMKEQLSSKCKNVNLMECQSTVYVWFSNINCERIPPAQMVNPKQELGGMVITHSKSSCLVLLEKGRRGLVAVFHHFRKIAA